MQSGPIFKDTFNRTVYNDRRHIEAFRTLPAYIVLNRKCTTPIIIIIIMYRVFVRTFYRRYFQSCYEKTLLKNTKYIVNLVTFNRSNHIRSRPNFLAQFFTISHIMIIMHHINM